MAFDPRTAVEDDDELTRFDPGTARLDEKAFDPKSARPEEDPNSDDNRARARFAGTDPRRVDMGDGRRGTARSGAKPYVAEGEEPDQYGNRSLLNPAWKPPRGESALDRPVPGYEDRQLTEPERVELSKSPEKRAREQESRLAEARRQRFLDESGELKPGVERGPVQGLLDKTIAKPLDGSLASLVLEGMGDVARGTARGADRLSGSIYSGVGALASAVGADGVAGVANAAGKLAREDAVGWGNTRDPESVTQAVFESVTMNAPLLVAFGFGNKALAGMWATTFGNDYGESRDRGIQHEDAVGRAAYMATAEVLGEKVALPALGRAFAAATSKVSTKEMGQVLADMLVKEQVGEQATTALQSIYEKFGAQGRRPDMTLGDYLDDVVKTAKVTLGQSLVMGGAAAGWRAMPQSREAAVAQAIDSNVASIGADPLALDRQVVDSLKAPQPGGIDPRLTARAAGVLPAAAEPAAAAMTLEEMPEEPVGPEGVRSLLDAADAVRAEVLGPAAIPAGDAVVSTGPAEAAEAAAAVTTPQAADPTKIGIDLVPQGDLTRRAEEALHQNALDTVRPKAGADPKIAAFQHLSAQRANEIESRSETERALGRVAEADEMMRTAAAMRVEASNIRSAEGHRDLPQFTRLAEAARERFGHEVVPYLDSSDGAADGFLDKGTGTVYVNLSNPEQGVAFTIFHEVQHAVRERGKAGDKLAQQATQVLDQVWGMIDESAKRDYATKYLMRGAIEGGKMTVEQAMASPELQDEMLSDFMGKRAQDETFWSTVAERNPKTFGAFAKGWIDTIKGLADSLRGLLSKATSAYTPGSGAASARGGTTMKDLDGAIANLDRARLVAERVVRAWADANPALAREQGVQLPPATKTDGPAATQSGRGGATPELAAPELAGEQIDREWTAFAADSGTLGVPRAEMPQIKAEHRGAMTQFFKGRGIIHEQTTVAAADLKPTQAEFSPGKVQKAREFVGGDRSILVSEDGHILDGHHQWLAKREAGEPIDVIRLKAPIKRLLEEVKEFPSAETAGGATAAGPTKPTQGASVGSVSEAGKGARSAVAANLSVATGSIPKLAELQARANNGDQAAAGLLHRTAANAVEHLLSGIDGVKVTSSEQGGLFGGELEPSLGVRIEFTEGQRAEVLAALARFAQNYNQWQIHVRQPTDAAIGARFEDGSYATIVYRFALSKPLAREAVQRVIDDSGLPGLSFTNNSLETYFVGDPSDQQAIDRFVAAAKRAGVAVGEGGARVEQGVHRLWPYGDSFSGEPTISYDSIRGDVRARPAQANPITRDFAREAYGGEVEPVQQAAAITPEQRALQERIAQAYDRLPMSDLDNPLVRRAYDELAEEVGRQFDGLPIKVELYTEGAEPYKNSQAMRQDVADNNHLFIFATEPGSFGPPGVVYDNHPLLADSGRKDINDRPLLANDLLRAVHDYFAHTLSPVQFGPLGEEAAWKNHMATTRSPWARWALTSETRGQNSWVNFRPGAEAMPVAERPFSEQKVALLPIEFVLTGDAAVDAPVAAMADKLAPGERFGSIRSARPPVGRDAADRLRGTKMTIDDGEGGTIEVDAGDVIAAYDSRIDALKRLLECLAS